MSLLHEVNPLTQVDDITFIEIACQWCGYNPVAFVMEIIVGQCQESSRTHKFSSPGIFMIRFSMKRFLKPMTKATFKLMCTADMIEMAMRRYHGNRFFAEGCYFLF